MTISLRLLSDAFFFWLVEAPFHVSSRSRLKSSLTKQMASLTSFMRCVSSSIL